MQHSAKKLETIVRLAAQRGFVYSSSEIYGGFGATYDFGPEGTLLKKNIEAAWRYWNVTQRGDMEEIEGAIFMHPRVWEASGHVGGFADLLVEDLVTHKRYRADHLIEEAGVMDNAGALSPEEVDAVIAENKLKSPDGNALSPAKRFNLLVKTHLGPTEEATNLVYLKGESCQNIYVDWKNVLQTSRRKLPFGIAQIGKAFRNEITVKQFMFRTREFEQMDVQYFVYPSVADTAYAEWKQNQEDFFTKKLGFAKENVRWRQHAEDERAFYASDAWDIEYQFGSLGFQEIEGLHNRGSYDLDQHSKFSGEDLSYLDPETNERFNPYIVEASAGFNRIFLATLFEFLDEEVIKDEESGSEESRTVLRFPFELAPYKVAILPLMKKDGLSEKAHEVFMGLRRDGIVATYDVTASIGKRYRRNDEIGTPWCVTIDHDTLTDGTVTLRHRDTMKQERIKIEDIGQYLSKEKFGK